MELPVGAVLRGPLTRVTSISGTRCTGVVRAKAVVLYRPQSNRPATVPPRSSSHLRRRGAQCDEYQRCVVRGRVLCDDYEVVTIGVCLQN